MVLAKTYQYGLVTDLFSVKDSKICKVKVTYQNSNENPKRETFWAVRELIVIHYVDEIDINDKLNEIYDSELWKMN